MLMPPKKIHCCSTPLLVGTSSGISLRDGQSRATTWPVSLASQPPSEFTGFLPFKSMGWWLSGDLHRSVSLICALPAALLLGLGTSNYISEVGRCPRSAPCPLHPSCIFTVRQLSPLSSVTSFRQEARETPGNWGNVLPGP